jgi:hypothetical protein
MEFAYPCNIDSGFESAGVSEDLRKKTVVQEQRRRRKLTQKRARARAHTHTHTHTTKGQLQPHLFDKVNSLLCKASLEMLDYQQHNLRVY